MGLAGACELNRDLYASLDSTPLLSCLLLLAVLPAATVLEFVADDLEDEVFACFGGFLLDGLGSAAILGFLSHGCPSSAGVTDAVGGAAPGGEPGWGRGERERERV